MVSQNFKKLYRTEIVQDTWSDSESIVQPIFFITESFTHVFLVNDNAFDEKSGRWGAAYNECAIKCLREQATNNRLRRSGSMVDSVIDFANEHLGRFLMTWTEEKLTLALDPDDMILKPRMPDSDTYRHGRLKLQEEGLAVPVDATQRSVPVRCRPVVDTNCAV